LSEPAPHLHLIDTGTGEVYERCPNCEAMEDQLAGAESNVRSMRGIMAKLKREVAGEVDRNHALFPDAVALWRYWQERCRPRSTGELTDKRMRHVLPYLRREGPEACREAIRGAAFDPFMTPQKNGKTRVHNDWDQIFPIQDEGKFESFRERAPDHEPTAAQRTMKETALEVVRRLAERARLVDTEDSVACAHLLLEVDRLVREWRETPLEGGTT
jgi:hypothetical protein